MNEVEQLERANFQCNISEEKKEDHLQEKETKRKRNAYPLTYREVISNAILSLPSKRATLADIYSFIQVNYPGFTENRARWKNTVRHNLTLHECFQRNIDKARRYWSIHPSFLADFSRGDFSRRKLTQDLLLSSEREGILRENRFAVPSSNSTCHVCKSRHQLYLSHGSLHYHRDDMLPPYWQHPYFYRDHRICCTRFYF